MACRVSLRPAAWGFRPVTLAKGGHVGSVGVIPIVDFVTHLLARLLLYLVLLVIMPNLMGCETQPQYERDFQAEVVNQSTQDDVRSKFGTPEMVTPLADGGEVWVYRYSRGKFSTGYAATAECWEYSLTFNAKKVLRKSDAVNCSGKLPGYDPKEDEKYLKEPGQR